MKYTVTNPFNFNVNVRVGSISFLNAGASVPVDISEKEAEALQRAGFSVKLPGQVPSEVQPLGTETPEIPVNTVEKTASIGNADTAKTAKGIVTSSRKKS